MYDMHTYGGIHVPFYRFVRAWTLYDNNIQCLAEKTIRYENPLFSDFAVYTEITSRIYDTLSRDAYHFTIRDNQKHTPVYDATFQTPDEPFLNAVRSCRGLDLFTDIFQTALSITVIMWCAFLSIRYALTCS